MSGALHSRDMDKDVRRAVARLNKTVTAIRAEEFDRAGCDDGLLGLSWPWKRERGALRQVGPSALIARVVAGETRRDSFEFVIPC